jgi:opacity protein-like surface antigen
MTKTCSAACRVLLAGAAVALTSAIVARPAAAEEDAFRSTAEIYLMGASMSGTVGVGPLETEIDVPSSKIFENLKFAVLTDYRGEARTWAVMADFVYMNLGGSGTGSPGLGSAEVGAEEFIVDLAGAWRISKSFELLGGGRYTHLRTTATLTTPLNTRDARIDQDWFDPFVGAQAFLPLSKALQLQLRGDVGGFGVGCTFTWQATARLNWQVSRVVRLGLGYRWLDQDFETGSGTDYFKWDVLTQGPLLAAGVTF